MFFEDNHLLLFRQIVLDGEKVGTIYFRYDLLEIRSRLVRYAGITTSTCCRQPWRPTSC